MYDKLLLKIRASFNNKSNSIIELDFSDEEIEKIGEFLSKIKSKNIVLNREKSIVGAMFLIYIVFRLKNDFNYKSIWNKIYSILDENFSRNFFNANHHPNSLLKESIEFACDEFNIRNDFENKDTHQYLRNTILLQIGLLNSFENLKLWLSNYQLPLTISQLIDKESPNYSKEFDEAWRALRRYRDNLLNESQIKNILQNNIWFNHLDLDKLLKASKQKFKVFLNSNDDVDVFYLEKIFYTDNGLEFILNAQDIYALNLSGFRYEIRIDNEIVGLLLLNENKKLDLFEPIKLINPTNYIVNLEIINEDKEVVYFTEIELFDFSEQILLFDDKGNIYNNIFRKLNSNRKYYVLMDSDLESDFNVELQREFFNGYAVLVPNISYKDNFRVLYEEEELFRLNFTEYIKKPEFIDNLVLYTANENFEIGKEYEFYIKELKIKDDYDVELVDIKDCKIIKWTYNGGYVDDISNFSTILELTTEMIVYPKHTIFLKYKNRVFKKVLYCHFLEKFSKYRLFQIQNDNVKLIEKNDFLTKEDLTSKFYLSYFKNSSKEVYIKNKTYFYQKVKLNKFFILNDLIGFGEELFISDSLFNSDLEKLFNYSNSQKYITIKNNKLNFINNLNLDNLSIIVLDENFEILEYQNQNIVGALLVVNNTIIDNAYSIDIKNFPITMDIIKYLILANYKFLQKKYVNLLRNFIKDNLYEVFVELFNNKIKVNNYIFNVEFDKLAILFEHLFFEIEFNKEMANKILSYFILNKRENSLIQTPIILFKLLKATKSKELVKYFLIGLKEIELVDERDENFTNYIVNSLFELERTKSIHKHNLKIALHYKNGKFYLKKALEKLNG